MAKKTGWLDRLLKVFKAASAVGPSVVAVVDPKDAKLAQELGGIANTAIDATKGNK